MPPQRAGSLSAHCSGVGAAHRQNIVHRDLKPLNIMVQDDVPMLKASRSRLGLAKIKSGELLGFVCAGANKRPDGFALLYGAGTVVRRGAGCARRHLQSRSDPYSGQGHGDITPATKVKKLRRRAFDPIETIRRE